MCGIVGIFSSKLTVNKENFTKALLTLQHRGPDGAGFWISNNRHVGLGHTRLSIVDLQGGTQPLFNQNKTIVTVVNGEFYDYKDLRLQLEKKGHHFQTESDSELVIHLYAEYGLDCVKYLRGEFAFILYDLAQNKMIIVRDRFGIKPLCYYFANDTFYVSSEAKAIFNLGVKAQWNEKALYQAFSFQYLPMHETLFKNINQVAPGHILIYDGKTLQDRIYWDLDYSPVTNTRRRKVSDIVHELDYRLKESIRLRRNSRF